MSDERKKLIKEIATIWTHYTFEKILDDQRLLVSGMVELCASRHTTRELHNWREKLKQVQDEQAKRTAT